MRSYKPQGEGGSQGEGHSTSAGVTPGASPWRSARPAVETDSYWTGRALSVEGQGRPLACVLLHGRKVAAAELGVAFAHGGVETDS